MSQMSLVETLVSRDSVRESQGKGVGSLSDLSGSSMDVDEQLEIQRQSPTYPSFLRWMGRRWHKGARQRSRPGLSMEIFLQWLALFDDRIPGEIQSHFGQKPQYRTPGCREAPECSCTFIRVSVLFPGVLTC